MKTHKHLLQTLSLGLLTLAGCGNSDAPTTTGFKVAVAPLTLPGITDTCYRVTVTNGPDRTGDLVWQEVLCADRYGDGLGSLSYVGPCDAGVTADNSVTLELLDLMTGAPPTSLSDGEYQNPCGEIAAWSGDRATLVAGEDPHGPCTLNRACVPNADVLVAFSITVMRSAGQGFFDIAVEFDDIFCSAKLDCKDELLFNGDDRDATAVVAFACTAGENEQTMMYISDLLLTCDGTPALAPIVIPAAEATPGQHGPIGAAIYQWAAYRGDEQVTSNGRPLEKCYWNRAIGLDTAALDNRNCTLSGVATASEAPLTSEGLTASGTSYPIVTWSAPVITSTGTLCGPNALNAPGSGVQTSYVDGSTDPAIVEALVGGASLSCGTPEPIACAAGPVVAGAPSDVTATLEAGILTVRTGTSATTVALQGYTLDGCHRDACCTNP